MPITAADFLARAYSWVGVPYAHQGRTRFGVDCAGLPEAILREAGELPDDYVPRLNYGPVPTAELDEVLRGWCTPTDVAVPACVIAIRWPRTKRPSHLAIYTGADLIHSYGKANGVVRHPYREPWISRSVSRWLLPGVLYE